MCPFSQKLWLDTISYRQLRRSMESKHILSNSPNEYRFSWESFTVYVPCIQYPQAEKKGKLKTLTKRTKKERKNFSDSQRISKLLFYVFHFPFIPFQSFANISLTWNNPTISVAQVVIIHSLTLSTIFSSCKKQPRPYCESVKSGLRVVLCGKETKETLKRKWKRNLTQIPSQRARKFKLHYSTRVLINSSAV